MKVKIFTAGNVGKLEKNINDWLKQNADNKIVTTLQSESVSEADTVVGCWSVTITIFYEG